MIPLRGAMPLIAKLAKGWKPPGMVAVTVGVDWSRKYAPACLLSVPPGRTPSALDFSWARGLDVLVVHERASLDRAIAVCDELVRAAPLYLGVLNAAERLGATIVDGSFVGVEPWEDWHFANVDPDGLLCGDRRHAA